ncbi:MULTISPECIES: LacI family DNA-binding transcriptional regulator [Inquilinus]|uniref:LacI family transcriptional regulator n=1 Tax=Inquilinus ginsengisoli TaxID=363840 RepID=A0ABU1JZI5_9PROT|nr:LacI family DNA-binding transcriptional regulator [Inquilinus ginsengisoli]MDR6293429.1 LacI family transcriptional regulator [Inquilinus ginsengisoli]
MSQRKTTIREVASRAGVSLGTASNVFNDKTSVAAESRQRVLDAAEALGYRPNSLAAGLRRQRTRTIGLVVPDVLNIVFNELVEHLENLALSQAYEVIIVTSREDPEREHERVRALLSRRVDGLIIIPTRDWSATEREMRHHRIPVVVLDRVAAKDHFPSVASDNAAATRAGTDYLLGLGHRDLAFVINSTRLWNSAARVDGFLAAMRDAGLQDRARVLLPGMTEEETRAGVLPVLAGPDRPTAIFTGSNVATLGVLRAVQDAGLAIPQDLSLLAFDDFAWLTVLRPFVSAIRQPTEALAGHAWRILTAGFEAPDRAAEHIRLPAPLIARETTAAPPAMKAFSPARRRATEEAGPP